MHDEHVHVIEAAGLDLDKRLAHRRERPLPFLEFELLDAAMCVQATTFMVVFVNIRQDSVFDSSILQKRISGLASRHK